MKCMHIFSFIFIINHFLALKKECSIISMKLNKKFKNTLSRFPCVQHVAYMKATNFGKFILVHGSPEAARLVRKLRVATVKL